MAIVMVEARTDIQIMIGEYTLTVSNKDADWWLTNSLEEGMTITNLEIERMLDDHFKENF